MFIDFYTSFYTSWRSCDSLWTNQSFLGFSYILGGKSAPVHKTTDINIQTCHKPSGFLIAFEQQVHWSKGNLKIFYLKDATQLSQQKIMLSGGLKNIGSLLGKLAEFCNCSAQRVLAMAYREGNVIQDALRLCSNRLSIDRFL